MLLLFHWELITSHIYIFYDIFPKPIHQSILTSPVISEISREISKEPNEGKNFFSADLEAR